MSTLDTAKTTSHKWSYENINLMDPTGIIKDAKDMKEILEK